MAINPIEVVSLLEKINLTTINNPKVLQNAVKAIELISNSSNPSIRQKALIFQEKLKENPTFIELNKKEETKQAEIQQERSERLQEQLQARRNISASEKLEKEKKEEKSKDQEFKSLLNSGSFSSLSIWQQLEVLDYISANFENLTVKQQNEAIKCTIEALKNPETAQQALRSAKTILSSAEQIFDYDNPAKTLEQLQEKERLLQKECQKIEQERQIAENKIALAQQIREAKVTSKEEAEKHITEATLLKLNYYLRKQSGYENALIERDKNGNIKILDTKTGNELPMSSVMEERIQTRINDNLVLMNEKCIEYVEAVRNEKLQELKTNFKPNSKQAIFDEVNALFDNMLLETENLKQQGVYSKTATNEEVLLQSKNYLLSDLLKSNLDMNMGFHIAIKDFLRNNYELDSSQKEIKSYSIFTIPFVKKLLSQGESGEKMLEEIISNQWFSNEQAKYYVQELKKATQEPDFAEKVAQAEKLAQQQDIATFRQEYSREKFQDALMNYFYDNFRAEYEALCNKTKFLDKSDPNYEMYKIFADGHIRDHLMKMDIKGLKEFIEKEIGQPINMKEFDYSLKGVGLYNDKKVEIDKLKEESGLGEEAKQENVAKNDQKDVGKYDNFLNGFKTKEQIEQTISDNSKRLGYETANPSKPNNQEEQINNIKYQQQSSNV